MRLKPIISRSGLVDYDYRYPIFLKLSNLLGGYTIILKKIFPWGEGGGGEETTAKFFDESSSKTVSALINQTL